MEEAMERPERKSSVLIAAASERTAIQIHKTLPMQFGQVAVLSSMSAVKQKLQQEAFDILIIYTRLPDEPGVQSALELQGRYPGMGIMLLVGAEAYDETQYRAGDSGIFIMARPMTTQGFLQSLNLLDAMRKRILRLLEETEKLHRKLEDEKYISRAKCLLIEKEGMREQEAHRYLEKQAMDAAVTKREVAIRVIRESGRIITT